MRILRRINPVGAAGSTLILVILYLSIFHGHCWWEMTIGDGVGYMGASALNYELTLPRFNSRSKF